MDPKIEGRLRCRYVTNNVPYLFIQPIKMEEALLKPRIVIYHNVISDDEIDTIKKLAKPRVQKYLFFIPFVTNSNNQVTICYRLTV
jgi:prolyl 4-hydroxylase